MSQRMRISAILLIVTFLVSNTNVYCHLSKQNLFVWEDPAIPYIKKFAPIAQQEMVVHGIPASIKLAQALVESEFGRSTLAVNSNNHFGIKCGSQWNGKSFYKIDDDKDENGELIESCFRAFDKPEESFKAHSEFLKDPKKSSRYGFLFNFPANDYQNWAKGLKDAGYATDPTYPSKLIRIIEKYKLHKYDEIDENKLAEINKSKNNSAPKNSKIKEEEKDKSTIATASFTKIKINDKNAIKLKSNANVEKLAKALNMDIADLIAHNEMLYGASQKISTGSIVFIEKKRKSAEGEDKLHKVEKDETLESISNIYGVRAKTLYQLNKIPKNHQPLEGQIIAITDKVNDKNKPKTKEVKEKRKYLFD